MASEPSLDSQLAALRAAAKSLRERRPSWFEHIFHPGRHARRQENFSAAVVETVREVVASIRNSTAKFIEKDREISELKTRIFELNSEIAQLRDHQERLGRESAGAIQGLTDRATEREAAIRQQFEQQFEQLVRDHAEKIEQVQRAAADGHRDLGNELRERIQHILDEQRVAIRQLSLKASEDAILSDRARRATELKLEELAKRLPPAKA